MRLRLRFRWGCGCGSDGVAVAVPMGLRLRFRCGCGCGSDAVAVAVPMRLRLRFRWGCGCGSDRWGCGCGSDGVAVAFPMGLRLRLRCGCGCGSDGVAVAVPMGLRLRFRCGCCCGSDGVAVAFPMWLRLRLRWGCGCGSDGVAVAVPMGLRLRFRWGCGCGSDGVAVAVPMWLRLRFRWGCGCGSDGVAVAAPMGLRLRLRCGCGCGSDGVAVAVPMGLRLRLRWGCGCGCGCHCVGAAGSVVCTVAVALQLTRDLESERRRVSDAESVADLAKKELSTLMEELRALRLEADTVRAERDDWMAKAAVPRAPGGDPNAADVNQVFVLQQELMAKDKQLGQAERAAQGLRAQVKELQEQDERRLVAIRNADRRHAESEGAALEAHEWARRGREAEAKAEAAMVKAAELEREVEKVSGKFVEQEEEIIRKTYEISRLQAELQKQGDGASVCGVVCGQDCPELCFVDLARQSQCTCRSKPGALAQHSPRPPKTPMPARGGHRQAMDGLWPEVCGQQKQSNDPGNNQHILNTPITGRR